MDTAMLRLLVLDGLTDDIESILSIGLGDFVDTHRVSEAIVSAMDDGLIEAKVYDHDTQRYRRATPNPSAREIENDAKLPERFWFDLTPTGKRAWKDGADRLDGYHAARPHEEPSDD